MSWSSPDAALELAGEEITTAPTSQIRVSGLCKIGLGADGDSLAEMAVRLDGNAAFEQWCEDTRDAEYSNRNTKARNDSNPPLRLLRDGVQAHACFQCRMLEDPEETRRNTNFRSALKSRLSQRAREQNSNFGVARPGQESSSPTRSTVLERGVPYPATITFCEQGNSHECSSIVQLPSRQYAGARAPNLLDPREFTLFILRCDHIVCQACLLFGFCWWYQNAVCPLCRQELTRTERFYYSHMRIDPDRVLTLNAPNSAPDCALFQQALLVSTAFTTTHKNPILIINQWVCEQFAHMVVTHLENREQVGVHRVQNDARSLTGSASLRAGHESAQSLGYSEAIQNILEVATGALDLLFIDVVFFHSCGAIDIPCTVSVPKLRTAMIRQVREAVETPIVSLYRRFFALELIHAGLNLESSSGEIFEIATGCPDTMMGRAWDLCVEHVDLTVAWLVWRHVTADPEYTDTGQICRAYRGSMTIVDGTKEDSVDREQENRGRKTSGTFVG
ncbi:hypothetical protein BDW02DRAFT_505901 [Decorospora gaudefroyi]|uniref:RING-type domain-containing protein n=1 Tax=Decorospora gaudefroyi TaxID=184978 RepID=A0A6A5K1N1_9PLEO|nr:hypothetical protein BDW02DRAFT_505901 [Decorospora gaudefroyi]